jgi:ABC-2 type transport system permease protein
MSTADKTLDDEKDDDLEEEEEESEEEESEEEAPKKGSSKGDNVLAKEKVTGVASSRTFAESLKTTWTIARRETRAYFDSLVAYVVIGGSTLGLGIYFFLYQSGGFWQVDRASMARLFEFMPWALAALVIPLVTMRAIAEEKRSGTLELLITMPVKDSEVILGKYFAAVIMCLVLLLTTLVYPIAMFVWPWHLGALDWGPVMAGYLGLGLFSLAGVAVGMMFSSITESQIIAFFLTAGTLLFFYILGSVVESLHGWTGDVISFISFQSRFLPFARGLIDTRAVLYFLSIAVICLLVSFRSLESRKWS